jgi:hypothetical protein
MDGDVILLVFGFIVLKSISRKTISQLPRYY